MDIKKNRIIVFILIFISILAILVIYLNYSYLRIPCNELKLPGGYTCTNFEIIETFENTSCDSYLDCTTQVPLKYLTMSECPYQALCLGNKCAVVCPKQK